jgi:hypothetical protein
MSKTTTSSKLRTIFSVIVIGCAYFVYHHHILIRHWGILMTFGRFVKTFEQTCDTTPLMNVQDSTIFTKHKHCFDKNGKVPVYDVGHNVSTFQDLLLDAVDKRCPIVIKKPFLDDQCHNRFKTLANNMPDLSVRVKENREEWMHSDNWFPSEEYAKRGGEQKTSRANLKQLLDEYESGPSYKFMAFENTLDANNYQDIWGIDMSFLDGKAGTTFMSHYNTTSITTPMHSAFWDSFAYQCEGKKRWKLMTPEDALPTVRFHSVFTVMKSCDRDDVIKMTFDVEVGPDTMFYFPPYWAHSVETEKGTSILLNYRSLKLLKMTWHNPLLGFYTFTGLIYYKFFFDLLDPEEVLYYYTHGKMPESLGVSNNDRVRDFKGTFMTRLLDFISGKSIDKDF